MLKEHHPTSDVPGIWVSGFKPADIREILDRNGCKCTGAGGNTLFICTKNKCTRLMTEQVLKKVKEELDLL